MFFVLLFRLRVHQNIINEHYHKLVQEGSKGPIHIIHKYGSGIGGSECPSPLQILILKLNYTTCRIVQPRSSYKDVDGYLISNKGAFVCMQEN